MTQLNKQLPTPQGPPLACSSLASTRVVLCAPCAEKWTAQHSQRQHPPVLISQTWVPCRSTFSASMDAYLVCRGNGNRSYSQAQVLRPFQLVRQHGCVQVVCQDVTGSGCGKVWLAQETCSRGHDWLTTWLCCRRVPNHTAAGAMTGLPHGCAAGGCQTSDQQVTNSAGACKRHQHQPQQAPFFFK